VVPEPVNRVDAEPLHEGQVQVRRVGPGRSLAPDNAFAVALLTLWHGLSGAGAAPGFAPGTDRVAFGPAVSLIIDELRSGRAHGLAATLGRDVIGFGLLRPGTGVRAHTGVLDLMMVAPGHRGAGIGSRLLAGLVDIAAENGLQRLSAEVPEMTRQGGPSQFFAHSGFREAGRLEGWIRAGQGPDEDAVLMTRELMPGSRGD
jgi:GNAT superfamily N-acetyltransferase